MGLEFTTAATEAAADQAGDGDEQEVDPGETFMHDGTEIRYYRPTPGQIAVVMAMTADRQQDQSKVAGYVDFFFSVLDEHSQQHFQKRLLDRRDPFDLTSKGGINEIIDGLLQEWAARPTRQSAVSSTSRTSTGPSSTQTIPESASSGSPAINS